MSQWLEIAWWWLRDREESVTHMRTLLCLLLGCVAGASAFVAPMSRFQQQQQLVTRSAVAPSMLQSPARVEIELEDGEP